MRTTLRALGSCYRFLRSLLLNVLFILFVAGLVAFYHLIKVTDRKEPGVVALDQVRQKVASYLDSQNKEKQIGDFLTALRKTATIDYGTELQP